MRKEKSEGPPRGKVAAWWTTSVLGQSVSRHCVSIYIYNIYTLDVLYIVPTVFLGLNKLLLFGTKIVTLFGQRKNVFVKQKHSGQISNF